MRFFLSERDPAQLLHYGDEVQVTPLNSCCLIVVAYDSGDVYAQHCAGSDLSNLNNLFFRSDALEAIMVSGPESEYQVNQAHQFQLHPRIRSAVLHYYAYNWENYPMPVVKVESTGKLTLESEKSYHLVCY